ncbi:protein phosphatase 1 regulatory subunit 36 [Engraulis encrasicolus]|uniref:protein phosphatase 1 regulatory subunit 36 n=1 Tax=Engraulis encrasicolus TaxID=184585 RepID=UPI002FD32FB7
MPESVTETVELVDVPPPGKWSWNDETQALEFTCFNAADDAKDKRRKRALQEEAPKRQERHPMGQAGGFGQRRKTGAAVRTALFVARLKRAVRTQVTIQNVKQVALNLLEENEAIRVPHSFLSLMKCAELDNFLGALLLYLSCYFEKKSWEAKKERNPLMAEPSLTEKRQTEEACAKVGLAQKQLAIRYSSLILGLGRSNKHHHMACGRGKMSATHKDRQLYEVLYKFSCYAAWVTFTRKDMQGIQEEISRLLRSDTFNPTVKLKNQPSPAETETQEPSAVKRKSQRRPALSRIMTQRSPIMVSLLPTPQEDAPHLFQRAPPPEQSNAPPLVNMDKLVAQLSRQLTNMNFGIIGKPLAHFSPTTLMPHCTVEGTGEEEEAGGGGGGGASSGSGSSAPSSPIASMRARAASSVASASRANTANTATTRATTEGPSSDTE